MRRHTKRTDGPPSCCSLSQSKPRSKVVHCMSMDLQLWHTPQHCLVWVNLAWCCAELFKPADLLFNVDVPHQGPCSRGNVVHIVLDQELIDIDECAGFGARSGSS